MSSHSWERPPAGFQRSLLWSRIEEEEVAPLLAPESLPLPLPFLLLFLLLSSSSSSSGLLNPQGLPHEVWMAGLMLFAQHLLCLWEDETAFKRRNVPLSVSAVINLTFICSSALVMRAALGVGMCVCACVCVCVCVKGMYGTPCNTKRKKDREMWSSGWS